MAAGQAAEGASPPLRGLWLFLLAVGGAALGVLVIMSGAWEWSQEHKDFVSSGPFLLWGALICTQTAAWGVAVYLFHGLRSDLEHCRERRILVAGGTLWVLVLGGVVAGAFGPQWAHWHSFEYLDDRGARITILGAIGSLVAMYGVTAIWAIYWKLKAMLQAGNLGLDHVHLYLSLQDKLQQLLLIIGSALGLTILTVGAERNAVITWATTPPRCASRSPLETFVLGPVSCDTHFPPEYMLVYGFFFTVLLAVAYAPAQFALADVGRRIRDSAASLDSLTAQNVAGRQAERTALDELLDLKLGTFGSFRAALAILTPLIGSLTGLLFHTGG
jgi:hypothetical protein